MAQERDRALDFVRAAAMVMVVAVHAIPPAAPWYDAAMRALLFPANVIFFMMSGYLNIRLVADKLLPRYYYRKLTGILLPVLIYMLFRTLWDVYPVIASETVGSIAKRFLLNAAGDYAGGEFWFVFRLFGMLLAAPLIAPAIVGMSDRKRGYFVALFLLFLAPSVLFCRTSHHFNWVFPLGGFFGSFLMGGLVDLDKLREYPLRRLLLPTLASLIASAALLRGGFPHSPINDSTPMYFIAGMGLFGLLYRLGTLWGSCATDFMAKYSFGVYLVHLPLLRLIQPLLPQAPYPFFHVMGTVATLIAAIALSFLIENLAVRPLRHLIDYIWGRTIHADAPHPTEG